MISDLYFPRIHGVSTAVTGTADVLKNGQGCSPAKEELNDFYTKIVDLLKDEQRRNEPSTTGKSYTKQRDALARAHKMAAFYCMLAREWGSI